MKDFKFDEEWLEEAVKAEDKAGCDIHAGLELGSNLRKYINFTQTTEINKPVVKSDDD